MYLETTKAAVDAAVAAGGLVLGKDLYTRAVGGGSLILALSMKGLAWLVITYGVTPPVEDTAILQANLLAGIGGKLTGWAQT